jgi:hypothetical protein
MVPPFLLKGSQVYPFPTAETLHFFLKVLPVTRHFEVRGACGTTTQRAVVAGLLRFVDLPLLALLSLFFFLFLLGLIVLRPQYLYCVISILI